MVAAFFFPGGGEFDGMVINEHPDDVTAAAQSLFVRATGNFTKVLSIPVMTAEEFKAVMEKAKCKIRVHPAHGDQAVRNGSQANVVPGL
jgi:uncharacterized protein with GYD domain